MVTPSAQYLVNCFLTEKRFFNDLKQLQNNGIDDVILIGRKLSSKDMTMKVYQKTDKGLMTNKLCETVDFDGFCDMAYRIKPVYDSVKMRLIDLLPNLTTGLEKYSIDNWINGEDSRIIITHAAMDKFQELRLNKPHVIDKFVREATEIENNGNEDKLIVDVIGKPNNTSLALYLCKKINGIMRQSYEPERFYSKMEIVPERELLESYNLASKDIYRGSEEYWSKMFSSQFNVVG